MITEMRWGINDLKNGAGKGSENAPEVECLVGKTDGIL
jgi:hypothetical protein